MRSYVRITKYDGNAELFQRDVPAYRLPGDRVERVLQSLAAKDLTEDEIIESLLSRHKGHPKHRPLLDVRKENVPEKKRTLFTCGENPHVTAIAIEK
jgi:hypothetical protein